MKNELLILNGHGLCKKPAYVFLSVMLVHVFMLFFSGNHLKGYAPSRVLSFSAFVELTYLNAARLAFVLLWCHVGLIGPDGGIRQSPLREIKTCCT